MKILLDLAVGRPRSRHDRRAPATATCGPGTTVGVRPRAQRVPPGPQRPQPPADPRGRLRHRPVSHRRGARDGRARRTPRTATSARYSLGMRQRLGLAAALLGDPPVLVLDEPGNGLDPQGIRWLRDLLRARAAAGGTVFVSSHLLAEVEHLADEVVVISHGRLVATGALVDAAAGGHSVRTPEPERLTSSSSMPAPPSTPQPEGELVVRDLTIAEIGDRACAAGIALHELTPRPARSRSCSWTGRATTTPTTAPDSARWPRPRGRQYRYDMATTRPRRDPQAHHHQAAVGVPRRAGRHRRHRRGGRHVRHRHGRQQGVHRHRRGPAVPDGVRLQRHARAPHCSAPSPWLASTDTTPSCRPS